MELNSLKKIVLVSSGQPSLNPRLVKEADALVDAGYMVTVLYAYWNDWGTTFDSELIPAKKWKAIRIGGDPQKNKGTYFFSRIVHKTARVINNMTGGKCFTEAAVARPSYCLSKEVKKHPADLYIAHNLGALPAAVKAARANRKACGFDAEDFHRNEVNDAKNNPDVVLKTRIENKYLPRVDYLTASSAQIAGAYKLLFPGHEPIVIRNVFPKEIEVGGHHSKHDGPVKLLWLSQTIGFNRGLQDAIGALEVLKDRPFELHLLGNCNDAVKAELMTESQIRIRFHAPVPPHSLAKFAAKFDIGLALEPAFSINNDLALSNKIFVYLQAGLCVVASDTTAQKNFMDKYPGIGKIYTKGNTEALSDILQYYDTHRDILWEAQKESLSLARTELNWETEQKKFLAVVERALNKR
jgi:glycosyltransferase involved in cell wall biosynthesis